MRSKHSQKQLLYQNLIKQQTMQSACLQLQNYLAVILIDIALLDDFNKFNGKNRDSVPKLFYVKTMPARAMRACSLIAESNMFYIKRIISSYLPRPVKWLPAIQTSQMTIPTSINIKSIVIIILMIRMVFYNYLCTQIYW